MTVKSIIPSRDPSICISSAAIEIVGYLVEVEWGRFQSANENDTGTYSVFAIRQCLSSQDGLLEAASSFSKITTLFCHWSFLNGSYPRLLCEVVILWHGGDLSLRKPSSPTSEELAAIFTVALA